MNYSLRFLLSVCALLLWLPGHLRAQILDPAFHIPAVYWQASPIDAVQMPNGQCVVAGSFTRTNGQASKGLARFDAVGIEDQTFRQNLSGATVSVKKLVPCVNGQLLVQGNYQAGTVQRTTLFRLNADGTLDPTLNLASSGTGALPGLQQAIAQPDGRILIMSQYSNTEVFRVLSDGSRDPNFNLTLTTFSQAGSRILLQPDGKIIVVARLSQVNGVNTNLPIIRVNSNGSTDNSFQSAISLLNQQSIDCVALDANGALLVGGVFTSAVTGPAQSLRRLLSNGALDTGFTPPASLVGRYCTQIEALPNGRILVLASPFSVSGSTLPLNNQLIVLQPTGAIDPTFQPGTGPDGVLQGACALANNSVLTWGDISNYAGQRRTLAVVLPSGGLDANFAPLLQNPAKVDKIVRQSDGKLLITGRFNSIDGHLTDRVARLLPSGQPDLTFSWQQPTIPIWIPIVLAAQADGKVLLVSNGPNPFIRLTASGAPDPSFVPALATIGTITLLTQLANGQILVGGDFTDAAGRSNLTRLNADGSVDLTFTPSAGQLPINSGFVQADGAIVCLVTVSTMTNAYRVGVVRLLPTGVPDPAFSYVSITGTSPDYYGAVAIDRIPTTGGYATAGIFTGTKLVAACTATGADVVSFASPFRPVVTPTVLESTINTLAVQSDGRILVGGWFNTPTNLLARLNANGQLDATFSTNVLSSPPSTLTTGYPLQPSVSSIVVQPDNAIVVGGYFLQAGGQPATGLARFLPAGVLAVRAEQAGNAHIQAWPVPARDALHLQLEASARPQRVALLDALGKAVLTQAVTQAELTLNTASLARGLYVLRVDYASGPATRRVVLE